VSENALALARAVLAGDTAAVHALMDCVQEEMSPSGDRVTKAEDFRDDVAGWVFTDYVRDWISSNSYDFDAHTALSDFWANRLRRVADFSYEVADLMADKRARRLRARAERPKKGMP
jgi:hypothetical protein